MKAGKLLLAIAVLAMAAGVGQAQTNRTRDIQRSAMRAMKNREQARKDSIEKAKAQAVIDSLNEVEAKREKQMKADDATIRQAVRRGLKRARTRGTTEEAETADIDVSGKTGETQENQVSKSSSQFTDQKTVEETGKSANTSTGNEGAYGRATRPGTSSSSNTQQNTGQRPPTGTSQKQENTGSRPSSGTGSRSGAPESSSNTGSRPSTSTGSRSGNDNSKSEGETRERGGIKGRGDDSTSSSGETRKRERGERAEGSNRKHMVKKEDTPVDRTKIFNEGFAAIADIDKMTALTVPAPQNANLPSVIQSNGKAFVLTKETHDARSSTDEIFATNYENIYPGAIIWADGALANGDPTLVGLPAGKVTLRVDFNTGGRQQQG